MSKAGSPHSHVDAPFVTLKGLSELGAGPHGAHEFECECDELIFGASNDVCRSYDRND